MKKYITAILFASLCLTSQADDNKYLTATMNGNEQSIELATIQKITFADGQVVIATSEGTIQLPISEMQKFSFTATATAINNLGTQSKNILVTNGVIRVNGKGLLRIFNSEGRLVSLNNVQGSTSISTSALPHGLYIIQLGEETVKFVR